MIPAHRPSTKSHSFAFCWQAQADGMGPEPVTLPGAPPGIYGCDYNKLMAVMADVARARRAVLQGDLSAAAVGPLTPKIPRLVLKGDLSAAAVDP